MSFDSIRFRHLDYGYAVTSYSSQGQTVDRVIVNADTKESEVLLNRRMGYVAVSRAREEALIYTNSKDELGAALDRAVDKQMGLEAVRQASRIEPPAETHDVAKPSDRGHEVNADRHSLGVSW